MVRFKVIKGSHILLTVAVVLLIAVLAAIITVSIASEDSAPVLNQANLVAANPSNEEAAKAEPAFAAVSVTSDSLELDPGGNSGLSIEIVHTEPPKEKPTVLIYHTHTHEAYAQNSEDPYEAVEAWRTMDHDHSVVRVGAELANLLQNKGFSVTHNITDHELNELKTAYTRSVKTLESYPGQFDLYIDLHRDAFTEGEPVQVFLPDGRACARLMMLVGNGNGFEEKPFYKENLAFARELTVRLNEALPGLCKDVLVKDGRYNQHIGVFSILVEVGHNKNTLEEALASLPYLASGISDLLIENSSPELTNMKNAAMSD